MPRVLAVLGVVLAGCAAPGRGARPAALTGLLTPTTFRDCRDPARVYRVVDETGTLARRRAAALAFSWPGEAVVAEVDGVLGPPEGAGEAGVLRVTGVLAVQPKSFRTTCVPFDFWGLGTEPNWSLQISRAEDLIDFRDWRDERAWHFPFTRPKVRAGALVYDARGADDARLRVEVVERRCSDGMSDTTYDYAMTVVLDDRAFRGCALRFPSGR